MYSNDAAKLVVEKAAKAVNHGASVQQQATRIHTAIKQMRQQGMDAKGIRRVLREANAANGGDASQLEASLDALVPEDAPAPSARESKRTWAEHLAQTHFEFSISRWKANVPHGGFDRMLREWRAKMGTIFQDGKPGPLEREVRTYFEVSGASYCQQMALIEPMFYESEPHGSLAGITVAGYSNALFTLCKGYGIDQQRFYQLIFLSWHALRHYDTGKRVYVVDAGLGEALQDTSLRGLEGQDINLPFEAIYIQPPELANPMRVRNEESGWHRVTGIYVAEDTRLTAAGKQRWREMRQAVMDNGMPKVYPPQDVGVWECEEGTHCTRMLQILVVGENKSDDPKAMADDALYWFAVPLETRSFYECAKERIQEFVRIGPQERHEYIRVANWVANVLMYVTCANPGEKFTADKESRQLWERIKKLPPKSPKRKRLMGQVRERDPRERIMLKHASIVVDRSREPGEATGTGSGRKVTVRTKVAGHYRTVRVGPGRTGRRHRWIEPFWRGPEMAEVVAKRHVVR